MFQGATQLNLDAKGRMSVPTKARDPLTQGGTVKLVLTAHPEGCVLIYSESAWEPVRAQVETFPAFHPQASWWKRLLLGFEEHVEPDASGRVLLSPALRLHAKLEREAMMVGQGRYFELWDSGVWSAKLGQALAGTGAPPAGPMNVVIEGNRIARIASAGKSLGPYAPRTRPDTDMRPAVCSRSKSRA